MSIRPTPFLRLKIIARSYTFVHPNSTCSFLQIGFNAGDGERFVELPQSGTVSVSEIDSDSNGDVLGRFVFRVNSQNETATEAQLSCLSPGSPRLPIFITIKSIHSKSFLRMGSQEIFVIFPAQYMAH